MLTLQDAPGASQTGGEGRAAGIEGAIDVAIA
jgi:hypothetical protein